MLNEFGANLLVVELFLWAVSSLLQHSSQSTKQIDNG